jgi:hypothetical protein
MTSVLLWLRIMCTDGIFAVHNLWFMISNAGVARTSCAL